MREKVLPVISRELKLEPDKESRGIVIQGIQYSRILGDNKISDIVIQTISPKKERGNHYHLRKTEWFIPLRGRAKLIWYDNADPEKQLRTEVMDGDSLFKNPRIFEVKPDTCHLVKNEEDEDFLMLALVNIFDIEDMHKCTIRPS